MFTLIFAALLWKGIFDGEEKLLILVAMFLDLIIIAMGFTFLSTPVK